MSINVHYCFDTINYNGQLCPPRRQIGLLSSQIGLLNKGSFTNDVVGLGGGGFQIMTADDGWRGVFAEDDDIFYNHFRANFCQFYY